MGRDITGVRNDKKPSGHTVKSNGVSHDTTSQIISENGKAENTVVENHTVEDSLDEECQGKQDVLGVKSINCEVGTPEEKSQKPEIQKPSEKTSTSPVIPALGSLAADNFQTDSKVSQSSSSSKTEKQASISTADSDANCSPNIKEFHSPKDRSTYNLTLYTLKVFRASEQIHN